MKLLTPAQLQDGKQAQITKDLLRTEEMAKVASKTRKELANAEADFHSVLAKNRKKWALEEEEHAKHLNTMLSEVRTLEARKAQALIPISMYQKQADELMVSAKDALERANVKENEAEDLITRLQDKLDSLGQREQDSLLKEQMLEAKSQGITAQAQQVTAGIKQLNQAILEFGLTRTKAERDIYERKTALALWDRTLVAKVEAQERTAKALEVERLQVIDERANVQKVWDELHRKKAVIPLTNKP